MLSQFCFRKSKLISDNVNLSMIIVSNELFSFLFIEIPFEIC